MPPASPCGRGDGAGGERAGRREGRDVRVLSYPGLCEARGPSGDQAAGPSGRTARPLRASPDPPPGGRVQSRLLPSRPGAPLGCAAGPPRASARPPFRNSGDRSAARASPPGTPSRPAPPRRPGGAPRARSRPVGFPEPGRGRKCAFLPPPPPPRRGRSSSPGRRRLSGNNPFGPSRPEPQPASPCEALRCVVFSPDRGWRILVAISGGQRPARWVHAPSPKGLSNSDSPAGRQPGEHRRGSSEEKGWSAMGDEEPESFSPPDPGPRCSLHPV
ncbi:basic salivary proline-rich protein 2-like [Hyaena hyaena]|uniref:basic salivary proline-rich protein 2-like n=1 Tax=Hyaena hyaena TaxID=95912 RepID=UPI001922F758|nr:basic salivary proline-rich protein 2-like [Hyaena hyaena]